LGPKKLGGAVPDGGLAAMVAPFVILVRVGRLG
jgi:hypothetical protein